MNVALTDSWFDASFIYECGDDGSHRFGKTTLDGAQGVQLWCPCGYGKPEYSGPDAGRPHMVIVPFSNPKNAPPVPPGFGPENSKGGPRPRWTATGTDLGDLTLTPSVAVGDSPECWHGWITKGRVT